MKRKITVDRLQAGAASLLALSLLVAAPVPADEAADPPDEALLMFLAEWTDADGDWDDPFAAEAPPEAESEPAQVIDDENPNHP